MKGKGCNMATIQSAVYAVIFGSRECLLKAALDRRDTEFLQISDGRLYEKYSKAKNILFLREAIEQQTFGERASQLLWLVRLEVDKLSRKLSKTRQRKPPAH
jgi:hypothetical protein